MPLKNSRENWRHTSTIDLTNKSDNDDDEPVIIQRPQAFPTFHSVNRRNDIGSGITGGFPSEGGRKKLPTYSIPSGGAVPGASGTYHGRDYVDHEKTTESIKELLEGINDSVPLRKKKGKKEKKVDDELASMMEEKVTLGEGLRGGAEQEKEDEEEEDEDEEEEDSDVVDGLNVKLLPHQIRGLRFLRGREEAKARGGILADDVWILVCIPINFC